MQFITLDQRIAVENFEVGVVYTVTFTSGDNFTGSCMGIGVDFVAFQRTAPEYIFCLTMTTAADVASIEPLSDDIGKILEYTGSVPATIKTDGSPLLDYLITGNTIQNGTPTPSAPIAVVGVGELDSGQYKIPILSAGQTLPVYLGNTQTTRRIKKLVLTGEENWRKDSDSGQSARYYIVISDIENNTQNLLSSHFIHSPWYGIGTINVYRNICVFSVDKTIYSTVNDFKSWLATQYANNSAVTIWYVLAESETGIVNEPLMKISTYADTVSYRQSGVNVPTADGLNIFDIDTTVKPSEVYLKYFSPIF